MEIIKIVKVHYCLEGSSKITSDMQKKLEKWGIYDGIKKRICWVKFYQNEFQLVSIDCLFELIEIDINKVVATKKELLLHIIQNKPRTKASDYYHKIIIKELNQLLVDCGWFQDILKDIKASIVLNELDKLT